MRSPRQNNFKMNLPSIWPRVFQNFKSALKSCLNPSYIKILRFILRLKPLPSGKPVHPPSHDLTHTGAGGREKLPPFETLFNLLSIFFHLAWSIIKSTYPLSIFYYNRYGQPSDIDLLFGQRIELLDFLFWKISKWYLPRWQKCNVTISGWI